MKILSLLLGLIYCYVFADEKNGTFQPSLVDNNAPNNPGLPLGEADFFLAKQLGIKPTNITSENMMIPPIGFEEQMEELEAKGQTHERKGLKNAIAQVRYHWPLGVVPYVIDAAFSSSERAIIGQAVTHIEEFSCVRFVARTIETDYMDIVPGQGGCYATIPYGLGRGRREVGLEQTGCVTTKTVIHEFLHILGVKHEQNRPDRDDFITIHWGNLNAMGGAQNFRDVWLGSTSNPADCVDQQLASIYYGDCISGFEVEACGINGQPYDYTSVMHYRLNAFAIDASQNTMTPTDPSITATGNTEMSAQDKTKLQCMYYCDGVTYSGCGGHQTGDSGTLDALNDDKCQWLINVEDGYQIELSVTHFDVDCADKLEIYDEYSYPNDYTGKMEYCNGDEAKIIISKSSLLYVNWDRTISSNKFSAIWKKVLVECCATVSLQSGGNAGELWGGGFMGQYTYTDGDDINNKPIFRKDSRYWAAVQTVPQGYIGTWVVSKNEFGSPGDGSGAYFGRSNGPKCVSSVTSWAYYDYNAEETLEDDSTLKFVCDVSCSADPPEAPSGSLSDWDGNSKLSGTIITYTCSSNQEKKYALCKDDGTWSASTIDDCGTSTPSPPSPPSPTSPPSPPSPTSPPSPPSPTPPPPTPSPPSPPSTTPQPPSPTSPPSPPSPTSPPSPPSPTPPPPTPSPPSPPSPTPQPPSPTAPPSPPTTPPSPPSPTPSPPSTTAPTAPPPSPSPPSTTSPTSPPSCKKKFLKNKMLIGGKRLPGKKIKTKNINLCWKKCKSKRKCKFVSWIQKSKKKKMKKLCMLFSKSKGFKKKKGYVSGKGC